MPLIDLFHPAARPLLIDICRRWDYAALDWIETTARRLELKFLGLLAPSGEVCATILLWFTPDHVEILYLFVDPTWRGRGLGTQMVRAAADSVPSRSFFLEVRASNFAARRVYERTGFHLVGRRPRYYQNPVEDALVMTRDANANPPVSN